MSSAEQGPLLHRGREHAWSVQDFLERGDLYQALAEDKERRFSWHRRCVSAATHPACGAVAQRSSAGGKRRTGTPAGP